jgi:hypothetical protein
MRTCVAAPAKKRNPPLWGISSGYAVLAVCKQTAGTIHAEKEAILATNGKPKSPKWVVFIGETGKKRPETLKKSGLGSLWSGI